MAKVFARDPAPQRERTLVVSAVPRSLSASVIGADGTLFSELFPLNGAIGNACFLLDAEKPYGIVMEVQRGSSKLTRNFMIPRGQLSMPDLRFKVKQGDKITFKPLDPAQLFVSVMLAYTFKQTTDDTAQDALEIPDFKLDVES